MTPLWAQLEFIHPARLLLLAALPVFLYLALRGGRAGSWQAVLGAVTRAAVVGALLLAFAGPVHMLPGFSKSFVLVADYSDSAAGSRELIDAYADRLAAASGVKSSVVTFGAEQPPPDLPSSLDIHVIQSNQSNAAEAVLLADSLLPDGSRAEIVLLTDGRQTSGDLASAVQGVRAPVSVVPLAPFARPEVALLDLRLRAASPLDEQALVEATIASNRPADGELQFAARGAPTASRPVSLSAGVQRVVVPLQIDRSVVTVLVGELSSFEDAFPANNRRRLVVPPRKAIRALVVDPRPSELSGFTAALSARGLDVETSSPADASFSPTALGEFDVVVLSDVSAAELADRKIDTAAQPETDRGEEGNDKHGAATDNALAALDDFVRAGGGLVVVGGAEVFGVEALAGTPLEALLPLKATPREVESKPTLALVLVVDKSKSMLDDNRLELAKAAARQTVDELEPNDKVGVIAFGTQNQWVSEIVPAGDKRQVKQRINTLQAEGQTDMYPALEKAYLALEQAEADRRHAIVLTDGVSAPGDFGEIARRMADSGITVSTVSISPGAEQLILKDIARIAGGRHYHCDSPADIADILVRDTRRVGAPALEFTPLVHQSLPGLDLRGVPPLLGFAPTSPHGGAHLLLRSEQGDPLLAWRRHGLGMTVAFPADVKNRWAERWLRWPGFARFWHRVVAFARRRERDASRLVLEREAGRVRVVLGARRDAAFANGLQPTAEVAEFPAGGLAVAPPLHLHLEQTAPGRYEQSFAVAPDSAYDVQVEFDGDDGATVTRSLAGSYDYSDELIVGPADDALLRVVAAQTGGRFAPPPEALLDAVGAVRGTPTGLWPYFLLAAAVLLVVDIAVRRLPRLLGRSRGAV